MRYVYAIKLERDEDGAFVATSRDIPEALAEGATEQEALHEMSDALARGVSGVLCRGQGSARTVGCGAE